MDWDPANEERKRQGVLNERMTEELSSSIAQNIHLYKYYHIVLESLLVSGSEWAETKANLERRATFDANLRLVVRDGADRRREI